MFGCKKFGGIVVHRLKTLMLDTSFLIRLLKENETLHTNAKAYFKYFLDQNISMLCSTIAVAEYCVKGNIEELPLPKLKLSPFNITHAIKAGEIARILFEQRRQGSLQLTLRDIIPNDSKLIAQTIVEKVDGYVTCDIESQKLVKALYKDNATLQPFVFMDMNVRLPEFLGTLDFEQ